MKKILFITMILSLFSMGCSGPYDELVQHDENDNVQEQAEYISCIEQIGGGLPVGSNDN